MKTLRARHSTRSTPNPGWAPPWVTLAISQAALGQVEEGRQAIAECRKVDERVTRDGFERYFDYIVKDAEHRQFFRARLREVWPDDQ